MKSLCFFLIFVIKSTVRRVSMHYRFAKLCMRIQKPATVHVALIVALCNETSVFCMGDVFELLSKLNVYVQGVRLIPVDFQTKLNTFL